MNTVAMQHQRLLSYIVKYKTQIHHFYYPEDRFVYTSNHEVHPTFLGVSSQQEMMLYKIIQQKANLICSKLHYYFAFMEYFSLPFFLIPKNYELFLTDLTNTKPGQDSFALYLKNRGYIVFPWRRLQVFHHEEIVEPVKIRKVFMLENGTAMRISHRVHKNL